MEFGLLLSPKRLHRERAFAQQLEARVVARAMVLHPIDPQSNEASAEAGQTRASVPRQSSNTRDNGGRAIPAWEAVERKQKQEANAWWLVAQSDHAALSGDLAANLSSPFFPKLDIDVVHAISLHDAGWAHFDGGDEHANGTRPGEIFWAPKISDQGKPLSFLEMRPAEFLRAWSNSIACAEKACAIGGVLVSVHFSRLAESRLQAGGDTPDNTRCIRSNRDFDNIGELATIQCGEQRLQIHNRSSRGVHQNGARFHQRQRTFADEMVRFRKKRTVQ